MEHTHCTLVTGASSGIGREIAIRLSQSRRMILHGRDLKRLDETRNRCSDHANHEIWAMDLTRLGEIEDAFGRLLKTKELVVDGFVHSAGVLKIAPMRSMELTEAERVMAVNFSSAAEIVRLLLKRAVNQRKLRNIVFISSISSKFGANGFNFYCASKGALDALMRALAVELAPKIRVNSVLPGSLKTPMTASIFNEPQLASRLKAGYPLKIAGLSAIADAVEFLFSDRASWITGQQFVVDGGRTVNVGA